MSPRSNRPFGAASAPRAVPWTRGQRRSRPCRKPQISRHEIQISRHAVQTGSHAVRTGRHEIRTGRHQKRVWNLEKPGSRPPVAVWRSRSRLERPDRGLKGHTPHHPPSGTLMGARGSLRTRSRLSEVIMPVIFSPSNGSRMPLASQDWILNRYQFMTEDRFLRLEKRGWVKPFDIKSRYLYKGTASERCCWKNHQTMSCRIINWPFFCGLVALCLFANICSKR